MKGNDCWRGEGEVVRSDGSDVAISCPSLLPALRELVTARAKRRGRRYPVLSYFIPYMEKFIPIFCFCFYRLHINQHMPKSNRC